MPLRTLEIASLHKISERTDLLPEELRTLGVILVFDILYDTDVFTKNPEERGGTWGVHFSYRERRQANVMLHLHNYLVMVERYFINSKGHQQTQQQYNIAPKGEALLLQLKEATGIE